MAQTSGRSWQTAGVASLLAVALAGFVLHASYPGYLNGDSFEQLRQIYAGRLEDWQSPFVALIWSALLIVFPGPVGFIVFANLLLWGGLVALAIAMSPRVGRWALALLAIPLLPGLFNYLGHVHRDAMLSAWLVASFSLAFFVDTAQAGSRLRLALQLLANAGAIGAFLIRPNAVFCAVALLLYANRSLRWKRNLAACALALLLMPATQAIIDRVAEVRGTHPGDSIKTYHLLALSYFTGKNLFPGRWTAEESRQIVESCYSPIQWDSAGMQGICAFIQNGLLEQRLWGSPALTETWLREAASHPLALHSAMAATFAKCMRDPNSRAMLYKPPKSERIQWEVVDNPPRATTAVAQRVIRSGLNDRLSRPWLFALLFIANAALLLWRDLIVTPIGCFSAAVTACGATYLLTYLPFNVSAEYRYFYWCGFAAYLGLLTAAFAFIEARAAGGSVRLYGAQGRAAKLALAVIVAAAAGIVAVPAELPTLQRIVTITPADERPIVLSGLVSKSTPLWMAIRFDGRIDAGAWTEQPGGFASGRGAGPLVARLSTLHQTIRLSFRSAPQAGRVTVEADGMARTVDTHAESIGQIELDLPPPERAPGQRLGLPPHKPLLSGLVFVVILITLLRLSPRGACVARKERSGFRGTRSQ